MYLENVYTHDGRGKFIILLSFCRSSLWILCIRLNDNFVNGEFMLDKLNVICLFIIFQGGCVMWQCCVYGDFFDRNCWWKCGFKLESKEMWISFSASWLLWCWFYPPKLYVLILPIWTSAAPLSFVLFPGLPAACILSVRCVLCRGVFRFQKYLCMLVSFCFKCGKL